MYILFALLVISVPTPMPTPTDRVTWTAEFSSEQSCEAAGSALAGKFNSTPGSARFVAELDYVCIKK
jgi:hypothetical protein